MDTKLKKYALDALETAKEDLCRDKYLIPVAFVVTDEETFDFNLQFEDVGQKVSVYEELVKFAKENNAKAIITINDVPIRDGVDQALREPLSRQACSRESPRIHLSHNLWASYSELERCSSICAC